MNGCTPEMEGFLEKPYENDEKNGWWLGVPLFIEAMFVIWGDSYEKWVDLQVTMAFRTKMI